jgi:type II secretory pathway pseudopilin PulG
MNTLSPKSNRSASGMTLVEMLVAVAVGMVVMAAIGALMVFTTRSFIALGNYNDLDQASRNALDTMSRDIRQTRKLDYYTTNYLYFDNYTLLYWWHPTNKKLYRYKWSGTSWQVKELLEQCDYMRFGMSQQNPSNNFNFYSTTTPATAKLIDVSWTCSRQILQRRVNTESVQTAKIVIRN